jgi:predicted small lipoprotein YifL
MADAMSSAAKVFGAALILAMALAGCGVRGSLETPKAGQGEATADANSGQGKPEGATTGGAADPRPMNPRLRSLRNASLFLS